MLDHIMNNIYTSKEYSNKIMNGCIVVMPPGSGKTMLASGLIDKMKVKTLVVTPNTVISNQWENHLKLRHPDARIGSYNSKVKKDGDIVVIIYKSIMSKKYADKTSFFNKFGLIIWDEIHMYCSDKLSEVFKIATAPNMLGLTGTPNERLDKFDPIAEWFVGPLIRSELVNGFNNEKVIFNLSVIKVSYHGSDELTEHKGSNPLEISRNYKNQIISDTFRNKLIANYAIKLYSAKKNLFIFTERRSHAIELSRQISLIDIKSSCICPEFNQALKDIFLENIITMPTVCIDLILSYGYSIDPFIAMGGAKNDDIKKAKENASILIVTYQYISVGFDCDKMDSIIYATPRRRNHDQTLGRIFRMSSATRDRIVIDIVDEKTTLKSQYIDRLKIYKKCNASISNINVIDTKSC
jgi:superfamily II DNA or RNA helicase